MIKEQQIEQIFTILTTNKITARSGHAELLNTLQAVVKVCMYMLISIQLRTYFVNLTIQLHVLATGWYLCS